VSLMRRFHFLRFLFLTHFRSNQVLVLGDSHALAFKYRNVKKFFPGLCFNVVSVGGATVSGLSNPNSKTQAFPIFNRALEYNKAKTVVILLGEVDTGFVIWYQVEKYGDKLDSILQKTLKKYQDFLQSVAAKRNVICVSAPLPTIEDGQLLGKVANERKNITASLSARVSLTIRFNSAMEDFCKKNAIDYINLDSQILGENGTVKRTFLNADPRDHHFNRAAYSKLICEKLKERRIIY